LISSNAIGSDTIIKENYINVSPSMLNCSDAVFVFANIPYNGNTSLGHSNVNKYNCKTWSENGPEVVHTITTNSIGDISAALSNINVDLDIFLLSNCKENSCFVAGSNSLTYTNAPVGTYFIVVDGNSAGSYTLTISYPSNSIKELNKNNYFTLLPNPNNGVFILKINNSGKITDNAILNIYSSLGKFVYNESISQSEQEKNINLTSLSDGIYFVKLILKNGEIHTDKFIIKK